MIQVWPYVHDIKTIGSDVNKLLQQRIDIVYTFGGDGTLLTLLKALYLNNDNVEIPQIAAFNMVSLNTPLILRVYDHLGIVRLSLPFYSR